MRESNSLEPLSSSLGRRGGVDRGRRATLAESDNGVTCESEGDGDSFGFLGGGVGGVDEGQPWSCETPLTGDVNDCLATGLEGVAIGMETCRGGCSGDDSSTIGSPHAQKTSPSALSVLSLMLQCWLKSRFATRPLNALSRRWDESRFLPIGVEVMVEAAEISEMAEGGGADSTRSGGGISFGVRSPPVMVDIELPDGEDARKEGCGGKRSAGSAATLRAGLGGVW